MVKAGFIICFFMILLFFLPAFSQEELAAVNAYKSGRAYLADKEYEKAITQFKKAVSINPRYIDAHFGLGQAHLLTGRYEEALKSFRKVTYLDDQFFEAYLYVAETLFQKGEREEAHKEIQKVLQKSRVFARGYFAEGVLYYREGNEEKAASFWEQALRYDKSMAGAHSNLGCLFYNQGRSDKALEHLREAALLEPGRDLFVLNLAWVLHKDGKRREAKDKIIHALHAAKPPISYCLQGILDLLSENWQKVRESAARALRDDPDQTSAHLLMALVAEKEDKMDEAREHYKKVLEQDPLSRDAKEGMKRLERENVSPQRHRERTEE
ncbi:MAG: tetratricopeptide repeat protein [Armatimonadetes bacterium]|nr:tetratricopeptide repeat protein [Armatimonadota bacterium]